MNLDTDMEYIQQVARDYLEDMIIYGETKWNHYNLDEDGRRNRGALTRLAKAGLIERGTSGDRDDWKGTAICIAYTEPATSEIKYKLRANHPLIHIRQSAPKLRQLFDNLSQYDLVMTNASKTTITPLQMSSAENAHISRYDVYLMPKLNEDDQKKTKNKIKIDERARELLHDHRGLLVRLGIITEEEKKTCHLSISKFSTGLASAEKLRNNYNNFIERTRTASRKISVFARVEKATAMNGGQEGIKAKIFELFDIHTEEEWNMVRNHKFINAGNLMTKDGGIEKDNRRKALTYLKIYHKVLKAIEERGGDEAFRSYLKETACAIAEEELLKDGKLEAIVLQTPGQVRRVITRRERD